VSERQWVCDDCGAVSANEDDPCSCEDDMADLLAEIKALRTRQRVVVVVPSQSAPCRVVRPQRGAAAGQDFLIVTGRDQNGAEVTVKLAIGVLPATFDATCIDTPIEEVRTLGDIA
jgi:hypothetical protein